MNETTGEIIARKDGTNSIRHASGIGLDQESIGHIVGQHVRLREYGHSTFEVSSGSVAEGEALVLAAGLDPKQYSHKMLAMMGAPGHFGKFAIAAGEHGLLVASSLSTEIELKESEEGREIRGGMGEALGRDEILLVANYHDEADPKEMDIFDEMLRAQGVLLRTESEENDFHSLNLAIAAGAGILMLCTNVDGVKKNGKKLDSIHVDDIDKFIELYIEQGKISKGGIKTKLLAAKEAVTEHGMRVVIGHSMQDSLRILEDNAGTWVVQ